MWTLQELDSLKIKHGKHKPPNGECSACAMEAAYLRWAIRQGWSKKQIMSGWTDQLENVCPYVGAFVRNWNDCIPDDEVRTRIFTPDLLDLLPNTRGTDEVMLHRMWMGIDWDIRVRTPAFLRIAGLEEVAKKLEGLGEIASQAQLNDARATIQEAQSTAAAAWAATWAAARAAAGDAAWAAAWAATWAAARAAAGDAAWAAAWDAARDAARAAAGDAAWAAAWDAARDAARQRLAPLVAAMQASAKDLIVRMCAVK